MVVLLYLKSYFFTYENKIFFSLFPCHSICIYFCVLIISLLIAV